MPTSLISFFYPKSIAVVGASRSPEKVGGILLKNIISSKYQGAIYPVNPKAEEINGMKCFKSISDLPEVVDLEIIATGADTVKGLLTESGDMGVKNVVVIAAGFKETGKEGKILEDEVRKICLKYQINLLGPNCLGFVNNHCPLNATFGDPSLKSGNLRFITQSGAIATSLFDWCKSVGLGFSEFITLGNKTILNENDFLKYFYEKADSTLFNIDSEGLSGVHPVGLYLESISDGKTFIETVRNIVKKDPVFIIKPGKTQAAVTAMQSHTGSIAGEDAVLDSVLKEIGATRCNSLEEYFDLSRSFSWNVLPKGPGVGVISNAGGPSVIIADAIINEGLKLAELDETTRDLLLEVLPRSAAIYNPVDVLGDALADRYAAAAEIMLQNENVNSLVVILTPQMMTQITKTAEIICGLSKKHGKPIFCSFIGGNMVAEGEKILNDNKIPSFRFPERAVSCIGAMWRFYEKQLNIISEKGDIKKADLLTETQIKNITNIIAEGINKDQSALDNEASGTILNIAGINVPKSITVNKIDDALNFIENIKYPVTLKISSPDIIHKKAVNGISLDIKDNEQLETEWDRLESVIKSLGEKVSKNSKIQIQKQVDYGIEIIIGIKRDPTFGPVVLFGAGGTFAEFISDRNICLLPSNKDKAVSIVHSSKIFKIIKDIPNAIENLTEIILKLSEIYSLVQGIRDIEINPVIVTLNSVSAVDGKVTLEENKVKPSGPKFQTALTLTHVQQASTFHYFDFEPAEPLNFQPGQYISVKVADDRINCYSIASRENNKKFSLFVDIKPGGPGSKYFQNLKVGDTIKYLGPFGVFTLKCDDGAKNLLFLGTGSGASPLRCMIESSLKENNCKLPIKLYIGLNYVEDVFWKEYLDELSAKYPNFKYEIAVWKPTDDWKGNKGFITDLVKRDYPDASSCAAYMCGSKPMIDNATKLLLELGCPQERIYTEKF